MPSRYLDVVKRYVDVTFASDDEEILDMIEDGMNELRSMVSPHLEFNLPARTPIDGLANSLLKDYVRYSRSGSTQYFREDNRSRINSLTMLVAGDVYDQT